MSVAEAVVPDAAEIGPAGTAPVVAIYRTQILPRSETFVRAQALALRRWRPVLVGENQVAELDLGHLAVAALYRGSPGIGQKIAATVRRVIDRARPALLALVRAQSPNLIHAHFGFDGVEAWPIARRLGIPLLVTLHGADITVRRDWYEAGRAGMRFRSYPRRLAALAGQDNVTFIAVSEAIRQATLRAGLPAEKVVVRYIGIDTKRFAPVAPSAGQRRPVILFMGRLVEKKGASVLLEAFETVRRRLPDAKLVVAGDGPERAVLTARAERIGNVRFVGAYAPAQATEFLAAARILCLPSVIAANGDAEGLPIVILEAQASGVPVVTSAHGGATEGIIDGVTGFAFPERDTAALAARLLELLTDDDLADRFAAAAVPFAHERFDIEACTAALETLYDDVARPNAVRAV
jgi:glycosyltransferase involved in cell wall biosynthesis